jgi:hypothetical protein
LRLVKLRKASVRTISDMVVDKSEEPISAILQKKQTTSGGIRQSHSDAFVSFYLKCISPLYHNEQSEFTCSVVRYLYMSRCEGSGSSLGPCVRSGTLIDYSNCGIEAHASRSWPGRSSTVLRSWSRSSCSTIALESVLNRPHDRGVGPQLLLDRGDAFLSDSDRVGSGLSSLVDTRSEFTVLDLYVELVNYRLCVCFSAISQK